MAYAVFDTPAILGIPGIKELAQAGSEMVPPLVIATAQLLQVLVDSSVNIALPSIQDERHRRAGVPSLLDAAAGATCRACSGGRPAVACGGELPGQKGTGRARRAPGAALDPWKRWTVLALLAHAFLAVITATERTHHTVTSVLIPLTCNEIRHLLVSLTGSARHGVEHLLRWSHWRRQHQARAKASHCRRREEALQ